MVMAPDARRLVGRDQEVAELTAVLDAVLSGGSSQALEIHGEPGIGKTRLLDELSRRAAERGVAPMWGHATEYERHLPFRVFAEVFRRLDGDDSLAADTRSAVAVGLSSMDAAPLPVTTGPERYRLYRTLGDSFPSASPTVLILDDLHWADGASLELLEHLLYNPPAAALLIAVAYRDGLAAPKLANALARARMKITRLSLARLRRSDLGALLPDTAAHRREALFRASGGNPLYLQALSRADDATVAALGGPGSGITGSEHIPPGLQALLATELAALTETQQLVAHAIAVVGDPAHLDVLVHVVDRPEAEVSTTIDALVSRGMAQAAEAGFAFRHPLLRAAAYQAAGPAWRIGAHRRAERYLEQRGGPLLLRAHHAAKAAAFGDRTAARTLVEAAVASSNTAPATAAEWLRVALRVLPYQPDTVEYRVQLLLLLARALGLSGELAESREMLHEVLGLTPTSRCLAVRYTAITERLLGRLDESKALLEAELARMDPQAAETGPLIVELAGGQLLRNDPTGAMRYARDAIEVGERTGDRGLLAAATTLATLAALHAGDVPHARQQLAETTSIVDSLADAELREHLHLLPPLAWAELHLERYPDGSRHIERGTGIARSSGRAHVLPYLFIADAALEVRVGRLDRARQRCEDAIEMSRFMGSAETLAMARAMELRTALWQRGPEPSLVLAHRLIRDGRPTSEWWAEVADVFIAQLHLLAGDPASCVTYVTERVAALGDPTALGAPVFTATLAQAKAKLAQVDEAVELAGRARSQATRLGLPFHRGLAEHAYAAVLADGQQPAASAEQADAAARSFAEAGAPMHVAMAREMAAYGLAATGELHRARAALGHAKAGYAAASAHWLSAQAKLAEVRLGARASRPGRSDAVGLLGSLSDREREVAALAAAGLTNREIAERLFLSHKTVEAHLGRVFNKLGVRSRVGLAKVVPTEPP